MTIGEHLLQVADAGLAVCDVVTDEDIFIHLNLLLAIEDSLDKGRIVVGLADSGREHIPEINVRMDKLRNHIAVIVGRCDTDEFRQFMDARARGLQQQFSQH